MLHPSIPSLCVCTGVHTHSEGIHNLFVITHLPLMTLLKLLFKDVSWKSFFARLFTIVSVSRLLALAYVFLYLQKCFLPFLTYAQVLSGGPVDKERHAVIVWSEHLDWKSFRLWGKPVITVDLFLFTVIKCAKLWPRDCIWVMLIPRTLTCSCKLLIWT